MIGLGEQASPETKGVVLLCHVDVGIARYARAQKVPAMCGVAVYPQCLIATVMSALMSTGLNLSPVLPVQFLLLAHS